MQKGEMWVRISQAFPTDLLVQPDALSTEHISAVLHMLSSLGDAQYLLK